LDDAVYRAWLAEHRRPVDVNLEFTPEQRARLREAESQSARGFRIRAWDSNGGFGQPFQVSRILQQCLHRASRMASPGDALHSEGSDAVLPFMHT
jgi:hypothetical protein